MSTCHTAQATNASKGEQAQHNALSCIHIEFITHPELWFLICAVQELRVAQLIGKLERMRELRLAFRVEVGTSTGLVLCIQSIHDVPGSCDSTIGTITVQTKLHVCKALHLLCIGDVVAHSPIPHGHLDVCMASTKRPRVRALIAKALVLVGQLHSSVSTSHCPSELSSLCGVAQDIVSNSIFDAPLHAHVTRQLTATFNLYSLSLLKFKLKSPTPAAEPDCEASQHLSFCPGLSASSSQRDLPARHSRPARRSRSSPSWCPRPACSCSSQPSDHLAKTRQLHHHGQSSKMARPRWAPCPSPWH